MTEGCCGRSLRCAYSQFDDDDARGLGEGDFILVSGWSFASGARSAKLSPPEALGLTGTKNRLSGAPMGGLLSLEEELPSKSPDDAASAVRAEKHVVCKDGACGRCGGG